MSRGPERRSGRPARVPGWTLGIIAVLVIAGILVLGYLAGRDLLPGTGPEDVPFGEVTAGDCLDIRVEGVPRDRVASDEAVRDALMLGDARRVACSTPHSHEVAETTGFDIGEGYRGDDFLIALARPACESGFRSYVGADLDGSTIGLVIVAPNQAAWDEGLRRAVCLVRKNDGTYATRPMRGSGS